MDWYDVEEILFDGTPEQIDAVKCPECGGRLNMIYFPKNKNIEIRCKDCYTVMRGHGTEKVPNFASIGA